MKRWNLVARTKQTKYEVAYFSKEWEVTVKRCGRWIDFENDYKTMNTSFMESEWWVFKTLHEKGMPFHRQSYKFGNLFVLFKVKFPIKLNPSQVEGATKALGHMPRADTDMDVKETA